MIAALTLASGAAAQGFGQRGGGGPGGMQFRMGADGMLEAPVTSREVDQYATLLGLTPEQKEVAQVLHEAQMAEFRPVAQEMRDRMERIREEFRESRDPSVWQSMGEDMREFRRRRTEIEASFMEDLRSLLTEDQSQRWPVVERTRRRDRTIGRGMMSGERVDLIKLVDEVKPPAAASDDLAPVLEQYAIDLDRALIRRNEAYDEAEQRMGQMFGGGRGGFDMQAMEEMMRRGREVSGAVREVNRRYARQIESMLPEEQREAFSQAFRRESFPQVHRPTFSARVLDAASSMNDLTDDQRRAIDAIRESHGREFAALATQLETEIETFEASVTPEQIMSFRGESDRMRELRQARRDLDSKTIDRVRETLTEAQRARLPQREEREEAGADRFQRRVDRGGQQEDRRAGGRNRMRRPGGPE